MYLLKSNENIYFLLIHISYVPYIKYIFLYFYNFKYLKRVRARIFIDILLIDTPYKFDNKFDFNKVNLQKLPVAYYLSIVCSLLIAVVVYIRVFFFQLNSIFDSFRAQDRV